MASYINNRFLTPRETIPTHVMPERSAHYRLGPSVPVYILTPNTKTPESRNAGKPRALPLQFYSERKPIDISNLLIRF